MWRDILKNEDNQRSDSHSWDSTSDFSPLLMGDKYLSLASYINAKEGRISDEVIRNNKSHDYIQEEKIIITEEEGEEIVIAVYKGEILGEVVDNCKAFLKEYLETEIFTKLEQVQKGPIDKILDDTVRPIVARFIGRILGVFFEDSTPIRGGGILASGKLKVNDKVSINTIVYGDYLQGLKDAIHDDTRKSISNVYDYNNKFRDKYGPSVDLDVRDRAAEAGLDVPQSIRVDGPRSAEFGVYVNIQKDKLKNLDNIKLSNTIIAWMKSALGGATYAPSKTMTLVRGYVEEILSEKNLTEYLTDKSVLPKELFTYGGQLREVPGKNPEDIMEYLPEYTKKNLQVKQESPNVENYKVLLGDKELFTTYFSLRFGIDRGKPIKIKGINTTLSPLWQGGNRTRGYKRFFNSRFIFGAKTPEGKEILDMKLIGDNLKVDWTKSPLERIIRLLVGYGDKKQHYTKPVDLVAHSGLEQTIARYKPEDGISWEYSDINERHFVKVEQTIPFPTRYEEQAYVEYLGNILKGANIDEMWDELQEALENDNMSTVKFVIYIDATGAGRVGYDRNTRRIQYADFPEDTEPSWSAPAHYCIYGKINIPILESKPGDVCILSYESNLGDAVMTFLTSILTTFPILRGNYKDGDGSISKDYISKEDLEGVMSLPQALKRPVAQLLPLIIRYGETSKLKVIGMPEDNNEGEQNVGENNKDTV